MELQEFPATLTNEIQEVWGDIPPAVQYSFSAYLEEIIETTPSGTARRLLHEPGQGDTTPHALESVPAWKEPVVLVGMIDSKLSQETPEFTPVFIVAGVEAIVVQRVLHRLGLLRKDNVSDG